MNGKWYQGQRLLYLALAVAVVIVLVLGSVLFRVVADAAQINVTDQTSSAAVSDARSIATAIENASRQAVAITGEEGVSDIVGGTADRLSTTRVEYANQNIQRANPQLVELLFFAGDSSFVLGQTVDPSKALKTLPGAACDSSGVYCTVAGVPPGDFANSGRGKKLIKQELLPHAAPVQVLAFGAHNGPLGSLYIFEPIPDISGLGTSGVLVEKADGAGTFGPYLQTGKSGNLILSGNVVLDPQTPDYFKHGQLPILNGMAGPSATIAGGLAPTPIGFTLQGDNPTFSLNGASVQGSRASIGMMQDLSVVNYAPNSALPASSQRAIVLSVLLFLILVAGVVVILLYLGRRIQRGEQENAMLIRARSEALTEDVVMVSQALAVAREGDLTVQIPDSESEVGLLSLSLNGLLSDYGQIVGGIIRASRAVQDGAARVDEGVRRIVDVATGQAESVAMVAASVEEVAASAVEVQQATTTATQLAGSARGAVQSGQQSVGRIAEAVDAIKEAAIGTTREFKRLQEDSLRLTALVSSVKNNAENLDMQAANASLEAYRLGTESGSAFATNIGRLARQAQETLADAEGSVRSVVTSIDEVNRRIERISEQVRRGVEEVRTVRSTFEDITKTNSSLVQFIDNVAGSAGVQAQSAQQAAHSIVEIAQVFEQFTELLITSGDEIANMRLIVAGLRESVADLKVDDTALAEAGGAARESAA